MKKFFCIAVSFLFVMFCATPALAVESGYEIPYSDDVDWNKFRDQGITLRVYNWGEYISVNDGECLYDTNAEFEKLTGIKVDYTLFATNEEMYARIKTGGASYDIIIPSDYMISRMINEGMLEKIDFSNIPNFKYINDDLINPDYDRTNEYSVPYTWGIVGIIYNKTMVDLENDEIDSWDILWDAKYSDSIFMFSNPRDTVGISLKRLGYSYNTTDKEEISAAYEALKEQKNIVQAYVMDEIFDKMGGGEAALAPYYAGDAITMMNDNPDLGFVIPKEGSNLYVDALCIPKGSKNKEAAELYINFMCETLTALKNCEYINYSTPHKEAFKYLDEEIQNSVSYPSAEILGKAEAYTALPADITKLEDELWTDLMSDGDGNAATVIIFIVACIAASIGINILKYRKKKKILLEEAEGEEAERAEEVQ